MSRARRVAVPAPLLAGSRVAVVAPGSGFEPERLDKGFAVLRGWGYEPVPAPNLSARRSFLAGSDDERASDLAWALGDPTIDAIWAARGGWGTPRLLHRIDLAPLLARPRWVLGFSDLTALQAVLVERGLATLQAPLVTELADEERYDRGALRRRLEQPGHVLELACSVLVEGRARGPLTGGCLTLLVALAGTPWQPDLAGSVVFLEDVGEAPYRVDRLLWQLRASGTLSGVAGLALGDFTGRGPQDGPFLQQVLAEHAAALGVPALTGVPCGHGPGMQVLPLGFEARIDALPGPAGARAVLGIHPPPPDAA
jgi:muramoyltetrapeptide carboxypeptidase